MASQASASDNDFASVLTEDSGFVHLSDPESGATPHVSVAKQASVAAEANEETEPRLASVVAATESSVLTEGQLAAVVAAPQPASVLTPGQPASVLTEGQPASVLTEGNTPVVGQGRRDKKKSFYVGRPNMIPGVPLGGRVVYFEEIRSHKPPQPWSLNILAFRHIRAIHEAPRGCPTV